MEKGRFIVLEGLDRSGKSTMTRFIEGLLKKRGQTKLINYPNRTTTIGKMINDFLSNKAIHLLFSANRWEGGQIIKKDLNSGINLICDRYWYSGVAYSYAKGLDFEWCLKSDEGLIEPDLVIYLKADPQVLSKRAGYGQERFEKVEFQKKVAQAFDKMFQSTSKDKLAVVDVNDKTLQEVQRAVEQVLISKFNF